MLSNIVFYPADEDIERLCRQRGFTYTRYVDDICISGSEPLQGILPKVITIVKGIGLNINSKKTRIFSKGEDKVLLGLYIKAGSVDVSTEFKNKLTEELNYLNALILNDDDLDLYVSDILRLRGKFEYLKQVSSFSYDWAKGLDCQSRLRKKLRLI
jgi:hypothetical protein